jgi:hypothetical protein
MAGIKHYTVNFFGLGKVNKNGMQSVYIRYLYTLNQKKYTMNFETGYQLTKEQILLLKSNQLNGAIQENLIKKKSEIIQIVETLNLRDNGYPDKMTLSEYFNKTVNVLTIDHYLGMFMRDLKCKQSSKNIYDINLNRFVNNIKLNNKPIQAIINKTYVSTKKQ